MPAIYKSQVYFIFWTYPKIDLHDFSNIRIVLLSGKKHMIIKKNGDTSMEISNKVSSFFVLLLVNYLKTRFDEHFRNSSSNFGVSPM